MDVKIDPEALAGVVDLMSQAGEALESGSDTLAAFSEDNPLGDQLTALHPATARHVGVFLGICSEVGQIFARHAAETATRGRALGERSRETEAVVAALLNRAVSREYPGDSLGRSA